MAKASLSPCYSPTTSCHRASSTPFVSISARLTSFPLVHPFPQQKGQDAHWCPLCPGLGRGERTDNKGPTCHPLLGRGRVVTNGSKRPNNTGACVLGRLTGGQPLCLGSSGNASQCLCMGHEDSVGILPAKLEGTDNCSRENSMCKGSEAGKPWSVLQNRLIGCGGICVSLSQWKDRSG